MLFVIVTACNDFFARLKFDVAKVKQQFDITKTKLDKKTLWWKIAKYFLIIIFKRVLKDSCSQRTPNSLAKRLKFDVMKMKQQFVITKTKLGKKTH